MEFSEFLQIFGGIPWVLREGCLTCPGGDVTPVSLVGDSGGCNNSIFFQGKNCKKQGGGKSHSFGFSLHRFFEMVRKNGRDA